MGVKLVVTVGLPGSGKTFYCKNILKSNYLYSDYICVDEIKDKYPNDTLEEIIRDNYSGRSVVIVDALLLTNEDVISVVKLFDNVSNLEIHWWEPDVDSCLKNDNGRRGKDSKITIKNAKVESMDISQIKKETGIQCIKVEKHSVYKRTFLEEVCIENHINVSEGKIYSDEWTTGGDWRNCWGNSGVVYGEDEPEFKSFDNLLIKLCPNVSFMQYRKLRGDSVTTDSWTESDYYGGSTGMCRFVCDLCILEESLLGLGLTNDGIK